MSSKICTYQIEFNPDWIDENGFMTGAFKDLEEDIATGDWNVRYVGFQLLYSLVEHRAPKARYNRLKDIYERTLGIVGQGKALDFYACRKNGEMSIRQSIGRYKAPNGHLTNAEALIQRHVITVSMLDAHWKGVNSQAAVMAIWHPYYFEGQTIWMKSTLFKRVRPEDNIPVYRRRLYREILMPTSPSVLGNEHISVFDMAVYRLMLALQCQQERGSRNDLSKFLYDELENMVTTYLTSSPDYRSASDRMEEYIRDKVKPVEGTHTGRRVLQFLRSMNPLGMDYNWETADSALLLELSKIDLHL